MLKKILLPALTVVVITALYMSFKHASLDSVDYLTAVSMAKYDGEGDHAPKVLINTLIVSISHSNIVGVDMSGNEFRIMYTGEQSALTVAVGDTIGFVGHIHSNDEGYLHATQIVRR